MSKLFEEMSKGIAEARAYMEGERKGYKVILPESVDVRGIRKSLHLSQGKFADTFGLSVDAVRHWESGRRTPEASARALMTVIAHNPQAVMEALAQALAIRLSPKLMDSTAKRKISVNDTSRMKRATPSR
jgi:putative transcriptional regulator